LCIYNAIANKDGVAHGYTRFNLMGKDLNRDWDRLADALYAPEIMLWKTGSMTWFKRPMPHLGMDFTMITAEIAPKRPEKYLSSTLME